MTKLHLASAALALAAAVSLSACSNKYFGPVMTSSNTAKAAGAVKGDTAELIQEFNSHDAARVASHDAADVVQMFHGTANSVGPAADLESNRQFFAANPDTQVSLSDPTVDVSSSADMAVLRASYVLTKTDPKTKATVTEKGNYVAGYKLQPDTSWKIAWSVVSDTSSSASSPPAPAPAGN